MSDVPQGDGWWLAVDGKYYPPEQHPDAVRQPPPLPPPVPPTPPAPTVPTMPAVPPAGAPTAWTSPPTGPPTGGPPSLGAAGAWGTTAMAMATAQSPSSPEPWYHAWWAIALGLLFCFPVGLVLLWTSRKPMGAKVGLSIATALLVVVAMISSGTSSRSQDDIAATAAEQRGIVGSEQVEPQPTTSAAVTTVPPPTAPPTTAAPPPTTLPPPPPPPAPTLAPAPPAAAVMPDVVCLDLQFAQDTIQAAGVFFSRSTDATGAGRAQIIDSNWIVVAQTPPPGTPIGEGDAVLSVVKDDEPNPC